MKRIASLVLLLVTIAGCKSPTLWHPCRHGCQGSVPSLTYRWPCDRLTGWWPCR